MDDVKAVSAQKWDEAGYRALQARAADTNLDPVTLLATDYLNHFNEIVMLLELVADMPDMLEDAKAWEPASYVQHFQNSGIADKDIAIEAYDYVPPEYREPFDDTVQLINSLIARSIVRLDEVVAGGDPDMIREVATRQSQNIQRLTEAAAGIMHGNSARMAQGDIDKIMEA